MIESLWDLDEQLRSKKSRLFYFYGGLEEVLIKVIHELKIESIFVNEDYTPFSIKRDQEIQTICDRLKVQFK